MKIETILSGIPNHVLIAPGILTFYPFDNNFPDKLKVLRFSIAENVEQCGKEFVKALRELPPGFYTFVQSSGYVSDIRVGKKGGLRVRPYDGKTINDPNQRPCLRIEVTR